MFKKEITDYKIIIKFLGMKFIFKRPSTNINNKIVLTDEKGNSKIVKRIKGLNIDFKCSNSTVHVTKPYRFEKCQIILGENCNVSFGRNCNMRNVDIRPAAKNSTVEFGEFMQWGGGGRIFLSSETDTKIIVGNDCLFSSEIYISTSDGHKIYNNDDPTQSAINKGGNIEIGNHVWIGRGVTINKNSKIPSNSVVGTFSFVNKKFDNENIILAGQPAKIVKENINWNRKF